jgi:hypothetical protein
MSPPSSRYDAFLLACLERLQRLLERHAQGDMRPQEQEPLPEFPAWQELVPPPPLLALCERFQLTPFERDVLLLAASTELDGRFGAFCAAAQGDPERAFPTASLALAALPEASREVLGPTASLRRWHLVRLRPRPTHLQAALQVDERVLHYLLGVDAVEERLARLLEPLPAPGALSPSHERLASQVASANIRLTAEEPTPPYQLYGRSRQDQVAVARRAAELLDRQLHRVGAHLLPASLEEVDVLATLWTRELRLGGRRVLLVDGHELEPGDSARRTAIAYLATRMSGLLLVATPRPLALGARLAVSLEVVRADRAEQAELWKEQLGQHLPQARRAWESPETLEALTRQFDVDRDTLGPAAAYAAGQLAMRLMPNASQVLEAVREGVLAHVRGRLQGVAEPLEAGAEERLPVEAEQLAEGESYLRHRHMLHEVEGVESTSGGVRVLLAGGVGSGQRKVAAALGRRVGLEAWRFHLGPVVAGQAEARERLEVLLEVAGAGGVLVLLEGVELLFAQSSAKAYTAELLQRLDGFTGPLLLSYPRASALPEPLVQRVHARVVLGTSGAASRDSGSRRAVVALP